MKTLKLTVAQMNKVVARAKFQAINEMLANERDAGLPMTIIPGYAKIMSNAYCEDKKVFAYEETMYEMRMTAEAVSGTYAEYKALSDIAVLACYSLKIEGKGAMAWQVGHIRAVVCPALGGAWNEFKAAKGQWEPFGGNASNIIKMVEIALNAAD